MKVVVTTLSILNLVAGVALIAIWAFDADHPTSALGLGAALAAQGYGAATILGGRPPPTDRALQPDLNPGRARRP